jgi:hypothetical protein
MTNYVRLPPNRHQVSVIGRVIDDYTKDAIAHASVWITQAPERFNQLMRLANLQVQQNKRLGIQNQVLTSADGWFYFCDLPVGDYTLAAALPSAGTRYQDATPQIVQIPKDQPARLQIPTVELTLFPTGLTGKIQNEKNEAIVMAKVWLEGTEHLTFSDAQGNYFLNGLEGSNPTEYTIDQIPATTVKLAAVGYQSEVRQVKFQQGKLETLSIQLKQSGN